MTSVCNQPVGPGALAPVGKGTKSNVGSRADFLGKGVSPDTVATVTAGTLGGSLGAGSGLPRASAGTLTSIEKPLKGG